MKVNLHSFTPLAAAVLVAASLAVAVPAEAATPAGGPPANATSSFDPYSVVQQRGVLGDDAAQAHADSLAAQAKPAGSPVRPVQVTPSVKGVGKLTARGKQKVADGNGYGVVVGLNTAGTDAAFIAIANAAAPRDYSFTIGAPGQTLSARADGTVAVLDASGSQINYVQAPWAVDANGKQLPTSYSVSGNLLHQHIDTTGAAFPVVADPSTGCGFGWCSLYFNKTETRDIASAGFIYLGGAAAACSLGGPVAVAACGLAAGAIGGTAQLAVNHGQCVGIFYAGAIPFVEWNPFTYTGSQCR